MNTIGTAPPTENQLEAVRKALAAMSKAEWAEVQQEAQTSERTLYNIMHKDRKPGYDTVFKIYTVIRNREQAAGKA